MQPWRSAEERVCKVQGAKRDRSHAQLHGASKGVGSEHGEDPPFDRAEGGALSLFTFKKYVCGSAARISV